MTHLSPDFVLRNFARALYDHCFVDTMQQRESIDAERKKSCLFMIISPDRIPDEWRVLSVRAMCQHCRVTSYESPADQSADTRHVLEFQACAAVRLEACRLPAAGPADGGGDAARRDWHLKLVDLNVCSLTDEDLRWADFVMISAMIVHKTSVREIVDRCPPSANRSLPVDRSLRPAMRPFRTIEHFVLGEAEELMPQRRGRHAIAARCSRIYHARSRPDITPRARAALGSDRSAPLCHHGGAVFAGLPVRLRVLRYHRDERPRAAHEVTGAVDRRTGGTAQRGWRDMVFVVDDNFIGNKMQAESSAARADRVAAAHRLEDGFLDRGLGESGR